MAALDNLLKSIQVYQKEIEEGENNGEDKPFDADSYWKHAGAVYQRLSSIATKLVLAHNSPPGPSPKALGDFLSSLEAHLLALESVCFSLPKSQGQTMWRALQQSVLKIFTSVESLLQSIQQSQAGSQEQRSCAGLVWQETDAFSELPKNNIAATLDVVRRAYDLVQDALSELEETLADSVKEGEDGDEEDEADDGDDINLTEADRLRLAACSGMVKTTQSLLKKTVAAVSKNGRHDSNLAVAELDHLAELVERLSPHVDDLVSCSYPPISPALVLQGVSQLAVSNSEVLCQLRDSHLTSEDDQKWVEFLVKANDHNREKCVVGLELLD